jgi:uncharacterized protein
MFSLSDAELLNLKVQVLLKGSRLPIKAEVDLQAIAVYQDLDAPGMFTLELLNWDPTKGQVTWVDDNLFDIGTQVEIQMGYQNNLMTLIGGEITGLEPEFQLDIMAPLLVVRGHDLRHRLLRDRKTRSFTKMKDSEIASQIATEKGLQPQVKDTQVKLDYVLQANQTDLEFLQERGRRIGYEVVVENKTLYFHPHQNDTQKVLTLTREDDLIEFRPRLSAMGQVSNVEVHSWNFKDKKAFTGKAAAGSETTTMNGSTTGPQKVNQAFGKSTHIIVSEPASNQTEADRMAMGQFNDMALTYITGEGICLGFPELQPGRVIEITGVGNRFSGLYYVTSATHFYHKDRGYVTNFTVRRNAA